jgi:pimeloyl-ACP methyl ester carboxylesterase
MRRWLKLIVASLATVLVMGVLAGSAYEWYATRRDLAATPAPGQLVDVGGHRLHVWCTGSGQPAVILDSGLGGSSADWAFVQPDVARFTRVCSYDRAGMGYSDAGPSPRTARRLAHELARLLERAGIASPVVLVAASSAGYTARVFASEHSERVAGLVLVDASHEDQKDTIPPATRFVPFLASVGAFRLFGVALGPRLDALPHAARRIARATSFRAAGFRAAADELRHIKVSAAEVRETRRVLDTPVVVVTGARGSDTVWRDLQRDQTRLSPAGCQVIAERSGHVVAIDQPEVVVSAVRAIVDTAKGPRITPPCEPPPTAPPRQP